MVTWLSSLVLLSVSTLLNKWCVADESSVLWMRSWLGKRSNCFCSPQGPSAGEYQPLGNTPESLEERRKERDPKGTNTSLSSVCKCLFSDF